MQAPLLPIKPAPVPDAEIDCFRQWRLGEGKTPEAVAAECSQLRSLTRDASDRFDCTLADLRKDPGKAAALIDAAGKRLSVNTLQARVRAFQHFLRMGVSPFFGKQRIAIFMSAFPAKPSKGWHDLGVSMPGQRARRTMPSPTPSPVVLQQIVEAACQRSRLDGAIAVLACFSGLDLKEIANLRWNDLKWVDQGDSPIWRIAVYREGHRTSCLLAGPGAQPMLQYALASNRSRDALVFPGRADGSALSVVAIQNRLQSMYIEAGTYKLSRWQLVSAFAEWLRRNGLSDHAIRIALGRRRAATVDRLLKPYDRLAAQELIDDRVHSLR